MTADDKKTRIEEIRDRLKSAPSYPWSVTESGSTFAIKSSDVRENRHSEMLTVAYVNKTQKENDNATIISNFPTDIDYLLTTYDALLREVDRLKRIIAKELSENDELGAEYTYVNCLKEQVANLEVERDEYVHEAEHFQNKTIQLDLAVGIAQADVINLERDNKKLKEQLACAVEFIEKALRRECICDAAWSGRDEAEYMACGCPRCYCKEALAKISGNKGEP